MIKLLSIGLNLVIIGLNLALVIVSGYCWKKYKNQFLIVLLYGIGAILLAILSYFDRSLTKISILSTVLHLVILCWYLWKVFRDKIFLRGFIVCITGMLNLIFGFYIARVDLSLPITEWTIGSIFVAVSLVIIFIASLLI